jgi:hypothetical protein
VPFELPVIPAKAGIQYSPSRKRGGSLDSRLRGNDRLFGPATLCFIETIAQTVFFRAVAEGEWAATFTYPTGGPEAIEMAKSILLDCAEKAPTVVTVPTTAITPDNAKKMMGD